MTINLPASPEFIIQIVSNLIAFKLLTGSLAGRQGEGGNTGLGHGTCHRPHLHSLNSSVKVAAAAAGEVSENNCQVAAKLERAKQEERRSERERGRESRRKLLKTLQGFVCSRHTQTGTLAHRQTGQRANKALRFKHLLRGQSIMT